MKLYLQILLREMEEPMKPCLRLDGKPRAAFDTTAEAEAFALKTEDYVGDLAYECQTCRRIHLARPAWLLPNRIAEIRRGTQILSSPVGDQDSCVEWLKQNLRGGDVVSVIRSTDLVLQ